MDRKSGRVASPDPQSGTFAEITDGVLACYCFAGGWVPLKVVLAGFGVGRIMVLLRR
ncbi:MAG: hypothetical protein R6W72_11425 [Desulfurivibrionaceae bacterium]